MDELIGLFAADLIVTTIVYLGGVGDEFSFDFLTPSQLYKNTKMNRFGCWLSSILISIIAPVPGIVNIFYFITHVGRK